MTLGKIYDDEDDDDDDILLTSSSILCNTLVNGDVIVGRIHKKKPVHGCL